MRRRSPPVRPLRRSKHVRQKRVARIDHGRIVRSKREVTDHHAISSAVMSEGRAHKVIVLRKANVHHVMTAIVRKAIGRRGMSAIVHKVIGRRGMSAIVRKVIGRRGMTAIVRKVIGRRGMTAIVRKVIGRRGMTVIEANKVRGRKVIGRHKVIAIARKATGRRVRTGRLRVNARRNKVLGLLVKLVQRDFLQEKAAKAVNVRTARGDVGVGAGVEVAEVVAVAAEHQAKVRKAVVHPQAAHLRRANGESRSAPWRHARHDRRTFGQNLRLSKARRAHSDSLFYG